jgi:pSer/pThr/pTyr-binding forkhead associated (FHA) protein
MSSGQFRSDPTEAGSSGDPESPARRYVLRVGPRQVELEAGETVVGRDEACWIVVAGPLVSRRHARFLLQNDELSIEDLGSTNGTFLNDVRIHGRVQVQPGDRILIGSSEVEVTWQTGDSPASGTFGEDELDRATPSSGVVVVGRVSLSRDHWGAVTERNLRSGPFGLEMIASAARLAERMFALGRPLAGRDILSEPLNRILDAARGGQHLEPQMLDTVGRCAIKLAQEVRDAQWVNLAVEIHLIAGHPMRPETLEQIISLRQKAAIGDRELIERYEVRIRPMLEFMPLGERLLYVELVEDQPPTDDE